LKIGDETQEKRLEFLMIFTEKNLLPQGKNDKKFYGKSLNKAV